MTGPDSPDTAQHVVALEALDAEAIRRWTVAAAAANSAAGGGTLAEVVTAAVDAAVSALEHTPEQLALLAERGVVDAGGRGLVLLLDALAHVVTGSTIDQDAPALSSTVEA